MNRLLNLIVLSYFVVSYNLVQCRTVYLEFKRPTEDEIAFMQRYGYMDGDIDADTSLYSAQSISEALLKVQAFAGLPQTGVLDPETRALFKKRRCGVKDIENESSRKRRYSIQKGWTKTVISYRVLNAPATLSEAEVVTLMERALAVWAPHGGLHFVMLSDGHADIQVSFVSDDHGDGFPFDGVGGVVAHAFPPPHGAMHFDGAELWSVADASASPSADDDATDLFAVAVHELGHALGLAHSSVKASVMYPYYQVPVKHLHTDDILAMHELYMSEDSEWEAAPTENSVISHSSLAAPRFTKADSEEEDIPDLCYTNYDTLQVIQGKIFVFEEEWMWVLSSQRVIEAGYPKRFHQVFVGLPKHVNVIRTIYERRNGNIRIFSGRYFWEFDSTFHFIRKGRIAPTYSLPSRLTELTTVFISNYNNKTYLIEYERFWRYDETTNTMDRGYPKDMSAWRKLPYPIDAAIIWKGDTYFFRGPRFWRFDNRLIEAHEYYPLPTAQIWFPCDSTTEMERYLTNDEP